MLLSYGAKNFCCFKEWLIIDLTIGSSPNRDISNLLCLKGANASGKTSAIKAISFISEFARNSFNYKPDEEINFDSFFDNKEPTELFIKFLIDNIEYEYCISLTRKKVFSEEIYRKDKRKTLILKRITNKIEKNTLFDSKKEVIIRENASIISTANQYEITEIKIELWLFYIVGGIRFINTYDLRMQKIS